MTEEERKGYKEVTWDDKEVCGAYMVRFCPHDLFVNTRSDLGEFFVILMDATLFKEKLNPLRKNVLDYGKLFSYIVLIWFSCLVLEIEVKVLASLSCLILIA